MHEQHESLSIGDGLAQTVPAAAISIDGCEDGDSRRYRMLDCGASLIFGCPQLSMERRLAQPRLIYIDDSLAALQLPQQNPSILLSLDEASI